MTSSIGDKKTRRELMNRLQEVYGGAYGGARKKKKKKKGKPVSTYNPYDVLGLEEPPPLQPFVPIPALEEKIEAPYGYTKTGRVRMKPLKQYVPRPRKQPVNKYGYTESGKLRRKPCKYPVLDLEARARCPKKSPMVLAPDGSLIPRRIGKPAIFSSGDDDIAPYGYTKTGKIRKKPCMHGVTSISRPRPCNKRPLKRKILNPKTGRYVSKTGAIGKRILKAQNIMGSGLMDYGGSVYE